MNWLQWLGLFGRVASALSSIRLLNVGDTTQDEIYKPGLKRKYKTEEYEVKKIILVVERVK